MNQLTEAEMQTLERLNPREFYQVLMQIVAGGLTAWRNESARPNSSRPVRPPRWRAATRGGTKAVKLETDPIGSIAK